MFEESDAFGPSYGDFTLISSDSVRFHIDRSLLGYVSGFFKDIFSLTPTRPFGIEFTEDSLTVKETSPVLDTFLRHIDPNRTTPRIEAETIGPLLEAARFYRVLSIITWFKNEVLVRRANFRTKIDGPCFLDEHPLLVLALTYKFGLEELARTAISQLIICDAALWKKSIDVDIDGRLVLYCRQLRDERIELYSSLVESLTQHELSNTKNIKDSDRETCMSCTVARAQWTYKMLNSVFRRPEWSACFEAYSEEIEPYDCDHEISWPDIKQKTMTKWRNVNKPEKLEEKIPHTPTWLDNQLRDNAIFTPERM